MTTLQRPGQSGIPEQAVPIVVGCRRCPRLHCGQRAHPPADHRIAFDESQRMARFYVSARERP